MEGDTMLVKELTDRETTKIMLNNLKYPHYLTNY